MMAHDATLGSMSQTHPAPVNDLEINAVDDGYVIYDPATERVHYLNVTSAMLYELCDGEHDLDAVANELAEVFALDEPPIDVAREGIELLVKEGVLA